MLVRFCSWAAGCSRLATNINKKDNLRKDSQRHHGRKVAAGSSMQAQCAKVSVPGKGLFAVIVLALVPLKTVVPRANLELTARHSIVYAKYT